MQKTFCDRCDAEIPMKKLHRKTHKLTLEAVDEGHLGDISTSTTFEAELCIVCRAVIGSALRAALRK